MDYLSENNNYPNLIRVICVFSDSDKKDVIVHIPFCLNHGLNGLKDFTDYLSFLGFNHIISYFKF